MDPEPPKIIKNLIANKYKHGNKMNYQDLQVTKGRNSYCAACGRKGYWVHDSGRPLCGRSTKDRGKIRKKYNSKIRQYMKKVAQFHGKERSLNSDENSQNEKNCDGQVYFKN